MGIPYPFVSTGRIFVYDPSCEEIFWFLEGERCVRLALFWREDGLNFGLYGDSYYCLLIKLWHIVYFYSLPSLLWKTC